MKTAVLLIIGSAVIGPIEGENTPPSFDFPPGQLACSVNTPFCPGVLTRNPEAGSTGSYCNRSFQDRHPPCIEIPGTHETTEQICARAMREIGADMVTVDLDKAHPPGTWWLDLQTRVRCIPAPSGLKY